MWSASLTGAGDDRKGLYVMARPTLEVLLAWVSAPSGLHMARGR